MDRSLSHTPLFQVTFLLQNTPQEDCRFFELDAEIIEIDRKSAKFDLTLAIAEQANGLTAGE